MKFKMIFLMGIFILILSIGAATAADENATQDLAVEPAGGLQMTEADPQISLNDGDIEVIGPDELYYNGFNRFDVRSKSGSGDGMVIAHINNSTGTYVNIYNSSHDTITPFDIEIKEPGNYIIDFELLQTDHYSLKTFNYTASKFDIGLDYSFTIVDDYKGILAYVPEGASGTFEFTVNGKTDKRTATGTDYSIEFEAPKANLGKNIATLKFTADSKSKYKSQTLKKEFTVLPTIVCDWRVGYLSDKGFHIYAPGGSGVVNITVDGKHYRTVEVKDEAHVPASDLGLGEHTYVAEFLSDEYPCIQEDKFEVAPNVNVPAFVKKGDDNYMTVALPDNVSGNLVVMLNHKEFYRNDKAKGNIKIPLNNLKRLNQIDVNYTDETIAYDMFFVIKCTENSPNWNMKLEVESLIGLDKYSGDNHFSLNTPDDYDGKITVYVDGKEVYSYYNFNFTGYGKIDDKNYGNVAQYYYKFDISKLKPGSHTLKVVADSSQYYLPYNRTATFTATNLVVRFEKVLYETDNWDVDMPSDAKGTLKFYVDGKLIASHKGMETSFKMPKNTKFGKHTLKFVYTGDKKYPKETITKKINYGYEIYPRYRNWVFFNDQQLIEGNKNILSFACPSDYKGTVTLTIAGQKISKKANKGEVNFDISKFKAGNYTVKVESSASGKFTKQSYYLYDFEILRKVVNIKASANSAYYDGYYNIKLTYVNGSPAKNVPADIHFGGYTYLEKADANGNIKIRLSDPKPGKCDLMITSKYSKVEKYVTLKHVVSLSAVKVKRSAKSLTLTATLKKGKTPITGKQVTFKFNGKVIDKVKTNSKGVAKVVVKSSLLKSLKAGKSVTYQASYKKDVVKRTVKVSS